MTTLLPLTEAFWPEEIWQKPVRWRVSSVEDAFAARTAAGELVALKDAGDAGQPTFAVYASARARVEAALGELVINGLRHGGSPVRASVARGARGWLIVVADPAADRPPLISDTPPATAQSPSFATSAGGLGLPMVVGLATNVGWFAENGSKHVWAMITDDPPPHLLP